MTEVSTTPISEPEPAPKLQPKHSLGVPEIPGTNSLVAGSLVLWKILAVYCMGILFISSLPWFLVPLGWALVAAAYSGCLVVGMDCSRSCFFENKAANELIGAIVLLPLFRSVESLRRSTDETSAWVSRMLVCLKTDLSQVRYVIMAMSLIAVAGVCCWYKGLMGVVKYWLVPFLYMHLSVGSFKTKSTEKYSYLALFPDVKQLAEMEKDMLEAVQKASEYIPVYNVKQMHLHVQKQWELQSLNKGIPGSLPSTIMTRIMLLRGKRDAILAVAALISLVVFKSSGAIALAVLCFGYCVYSLGVEAKKQDWIENLNTPQAIYITGIHVISLVALFQITSCQSATLWFAFVLWPLSGIGITGGAHRLWAHRSYEAALPFRCMLLILNGLANQGSIYHWARDHRVHHMASETDADPHNAKRGFFFAHMGWLYLKKNQAVYEAGKKMNFDDLLADPVVRFQKKFDPWFNMAVCFGLTSIIPWACWGESLWLAYLVPGVLRYCFVLHVTWCVNSVAHLYGDRPYDKKINPAENLFVSIGSIGEGWHNWHHTYPYDYAASELGISSQFNPTKLVIDAGAYCGLVTNRKRATGVWEKTQEKRVNEHLAKQEKPVVEDIGQTKSEDKAAGGNTPAKDEPEKPKKTEKTLTKLHKQTQEEADKAEELTIKEIRRAIPPHCFKRDTTKSMGHLVLDLVMLFSAGGAISYASNCMGLPWYVMAVAWPAYWWYQGLTGTALWVIAHECGHGGFSDSKLLNDSIGFVLHSSLLTPYFSWAITHAKHHRRTNHISEGETWVPDITRNPTKAKIAFFMSHPGTCMRIAITWGVGWYAYLFTNATGAAGNKGLSHFDPNARALFRPSEKNLVNASTAGMVAMAAFLAVMGYQYGWLNLLMVYFVPQFITNIYLVSITFMQHTHPDVPHMNPPQWTWLNGALSTLDRSMGSWVDAKLHHICDSHVVHHLFSDMPFYGAKEATPYVKKYLETNYPGVYKANVETSYVGFWTDFYWTMKNSLVVVKGEDGIYRFH